MKKRVAIDRADALRMNTVSLEQKEAWLDDLDGQLTETMGKEQGEDGEELLMPYPHEEIYQLYLICKIDYYNQEMELYQNDMETYKEALGEALAWWRRNNRPEKSGKWSV